MFNPGSILYFTPFHFKDGANAKDKFFIVLHANVDNAIVASLPTSVDHIPRSVEKKHGCLDSHESRFNCYLLESGRPVCKNNWAFELDTHIYGNLIDDYEVGILKSTYPTEGVDYQIIGELHDHELAGILKCIRTSTSIARRIKKLLT